jgi:hypothetical protein
MDLLDGGPSELQTGTGDRSGGPVPRWAWIAAGVAVLLLVYVVTHRYPATDTAPGLAATPSQAVPTAGVPTELPLLSGTRGFGPAGLRLLISGDSPTVIDTHTAHRDAVPGVPTGGRSFTQMVPTSAGIVATVLSRDGVSVGVYLYRPGHSPKRLASTGRVLPGNGDNLVLYRYTGVETEFSGYSFSGGVRSRWNLSGLATPIRDTPFGLVVAHHPGAQQRGADLLLVNPETGDVRRRLAEDRSVVAASDSLVAYMDSGCRLRCSLLLTNVATGETSGYGVPESREATSGTFSPDGRLLALAFPGQYDPSLTGSVLPGFAAVLDVQSGELTVVPGLQTQAEQAPQLAWSPGGQWLVVATATASQARFGLWRSPGRNGSKELVVLPGRLTIDGSVDVTVLP